LTSSFLDLHTLRSNNQLTIENHSA
jgi:hypothetical protein